MPVERTRQPDGGRHGLVDELLDRIDADDAEHFGGLGGVGAVVAVLKTVGNGGLKHHKRKRIDGLKTRTRGTAAKVRPGPAVRNRQCGRSVSAI